MNGVESIGVTRLANGITVATDFMPGIETVSVGVWVGVGTRHEPEKLNGISHLLEHMAFKGTERRSAIDIAIEIESVGGNLNAYTGRERTCYYAKMLADDLPLALDILADILQHSKFDAAELERERHVILQEIGQAEDTPDDIVFDHFQETAYPDQALGWPVLGRSNVIRGLDRDTVAGYMSAHYGAKSMIVAAAGRVDHVDFVRRVESLFGSIKPTNSEVPTPGRYRGGDRRIERPLEQVHLVLGFEGVGYRDPDYYGLGVLSSLYGGGMSSRLFQEIREIRGLAYSIYSFASSYHDGGLFGVYAGTSADEVAEVVKIATDELRLLPERVTDVEIARARAQLRADLLMGRESTSSRAEQLSGQLFVYGRPLDTAELLARIDAVDRDAVARIAQRLIASPPTVTSIGPSGNVPTADAIAARLA
ncbi:MAG: pitrilysin family protein [Rhodospirillaceae bacterium]|nr:pitrilysin family protein [Rhodospirillaceae bacterium]